MSQASDKLCVDMLLDSKEVVALAARVLSDMGLPVVLRPTFVRPDVTQREAYSDEGDLEIMQKVEIKGRDLEFTCRADYPYETVIVDYAPNFDKKRPRPFMYMIFNQARTHYMIVQVKTFPQWRKVRLHNGKTGNDGDYYTCPVDLATFHEVKL